jgi:hypothetical protein
LSRPALVISVKRAYGTVLRNYSLCSSNMKNINYFFFRFNNRRENTLLGSGAKSSENIMSSPVRKQDLKILICRFWPPVRWRTRLLGLFDMQNRALCAPPLAHPSQLRCSSLHPTLCIFHLYSIQEHPENNHIIPGQD